MKSANPLNAPLILLLFSLTFCHRVCWRWTPAAADSFIVLLLRLHLKSIRTNGCVFDLNVSILSSPRSQPPANQTCHIMWPAGGGDSGFKRAAPQDQDQTQVQNQDQDQLKLPDQQTVGPSWPLFLLFPFLMFQVQHTSSLSHILAGMQCARCPTILVLVAFVLCGPGVSSQPDRDQDQYQNQDLDLELRHHRLLQRARSAGLLSQVRNSTANQNTRKTWLPPNVFMLSYANQLHI